MSPIAIYLDLERGALAALASVALLILVGSNRLPGLRFRASSVRETQLWRGSDLLAVLLVHAIAQIPAGLVHGMLLEAGAGPDVAGIAGLGVLQAITCGFIIVVIRPLYGTPLRALGLVRSSLLNLFPLGLVFIASVVPLAWLHGAWILVLHCLQGELPQLQSNVTELERVLESRAPGAIALTLVGPLVVAPLCEEILYRGFLFGYFWSTWGLRAGVLISSVLFAAAHFSSSAFVPLVALGSLIAWIYARTGSLWYAVAFHGAYNGLTVLRLVAPGEGAEAEP